MSEVSEHAYGVIVAGGGGTRLWPKSRQKLPKHLLKLFGNETLLRKTYRRITPVFSPDHIYVITVDSYKDLVAEQLPEIPRENIITEPQARNTALAMGTVAAHIGKKDPEAVIMNVHADQLIKEEDIFQKAVGVALVFASTGKYLTTIAVQPTFPHTGLGYIRIGSEIDTDDDHGKTNYAFASRGFKEKPDLATARAFLASKEYFWNTGIYGWSVKALFEAFEKYSPDLYKNLLTIQEAVGNKDEDEVKKRVYDKAENLAIDVAVSEKAKNLVIIPGNFDWSDVGDWNGVWSMNPHDDSGNALLNNADVININTKNCLIEGNGKLIATIGLEDIVIVDTEEALLVCHKDKTQDVKKVIEELKASKRENLL